MAVELKFLIDGLDRGQPLNPEDFSISITEDDTIGGRIVSFNNDLTFGGDIYSYLYNKLEVNGYCELVRVSVQYICNDNIWNKLVDGYIVVTEAVFNLDRCEVQTKLYDETFSTKINNNKSIPFSLRLTNSKNGVPITPPTIQELILFNPATGSILVNNSYCYAIYDVFAHLVTCMSDGLIDFDSNLFAYSNPTLDVPVYTQGNVIRMQADIEMFANFEQLYFTLKQKLNLGMGFEKQANGRPLLRIEPISYFQQSNPSANLYDQPGIEMKFDTERLYASAKFGAKTFIFPNECDGGNNYCTFPQPVFRGFRDETFGFIGECNTTNVLNLETSEVLFDTNVIEDVIRFNSDNYDLNPFVIQTDYTSILGPPKFRAKRYNLPNFPNDFYNLNFNNEGVSSNWLNGYPNSLFSFFDAFDPNLTPFSAEVINAPTIPSFGIIDTTPTSYHDYTGNWVPYNLELFDNGNNFSGQAYVIPFNGVYTFNLSSYCSNDTGDRIIYNSIKRFDAGSNLLQVFNSPTQTTDLNVLLQVTAVMYANQGDIIVTDVTATSLVGPSFETISIFGQQSYFNGSGVPLVEPELQPVNINDVQNYLYKFSRPLSMAEINAITSETSKPILLGRNDDSLAVIKTYIKTINIQSVMRKNAEFELRSNKLLP